MARHRLRPHGTTRRTLARTALVGAVAGVPLLMTGVAAHAASDATWDRLAQCESGGRWDIDTGNGYHGGLQFSPRTWTGFGGAEFAPVAHRATRAEQIVVAERVLAKQGWGAWPSCSVKIGARGEPAATRPAPATEQQPTAPRTTGDYVVRRGDTLSTIAAQNGVAGGWRAIVAKNPSLAGNPDAITPGQRLTLA